MDSQVIEEQQDSSNDSSFEKIDPSNNESEKSNDHDSTQENEHNVIEISSENTQVQTNHENIQVEKDQENMQENSSKVSQSENESNNLSDRAIYDVIIIGAGISGLYSAYYLIKKYKNLKILIIEGKDRVGGKFYYTALLPN